MIEQLFTASIDSIITTDINGHVTEINPGAESMFGYSRDEFIGLHVMELYASQEEFKNVLIEIESTGQFKGVIHNKTKLGKTINSFLSANWIQNEAGGFIGMMGVSRDITDELSLQQEYKQLVNTISDIVYSTDLDGNFIYINEPVKKILGYEISELLQTPFSKLIHPPHLAAVNEHYRAHFEKRQNQSYLEFQVIKKDGRLLWVGQQVSTKFNPINKKLIDGFYGVVRNIDKQKKNEILLAESEEKYRELFDTSSDLIQSIDAQGIFSM